jgi:hypothetical protein
MAIDSGFIAWLQSIALYTTAADAGTVARWGADATTSEIISPLALKAGADAEAARQIAFLSGPLAVDRLLVPGLRRDLLGQVFTAQGAPLGYAAGADVFVIGIAESETVQTTALLVLRRLT